MTRFIRTRRTASMLAMAFSLLLLTAACQSTPEEEPEPEATTNSEFNDADTKPAAAAPTKTAADVSIANVYFDFDKSEIRPDAVKGLRAGAVLLKETGVKVVIAGHTDNRGSEEYNLALGERRAASVRRYLANLGVDSNQMTIVSYGEVRPAVQGNNETAWAKNRRAEFKAVD
jgi:peptidoglycan-associated lipoprotein